MPLPLPTPTAYVATSSTSKNNDNNIEGECAAVSIRANEEQVISQSTASPEVAIKEALVGAANVDGGEGAREQVGKQEELSSIEELQAAALAPTPDNVAADHGSSSATSIATAATDTK